MKSNKDLAAWAQSKLGLPYCYGTFGQVWTQALLTAKTKQYPSYYGTSRQAEYKRRFGKQTFDCVGLIKGFLWENNGKITYQASQDVSADGMRTKCRENGSIASLPEIPGILVFLPGHVGVYIGNGEVVEAKGFADGVVKTKLAGRGWKDWGKCPWIDYAAPKNPQKDLAVIAQEVIAGKWGNGEARKKHLTAAGYDYTAVQALVNELAAATLKFKVGSKVIIQPTAKKYSRSTAAIPGQYKNKSYTVQQIGTDDLLLKELYSWVKKADVVQK